MKRSLVLVLFWLASVGLSSIPVIAGPSAASRWMDVEGSDLPMFSAVQHGSELWVVVGDGDIGRIMKWSGTTLEAVGHPFYHPDDVNLMSYQGEMYSGGQYVLDAETGEWWGWRRWNGSAWESPVDSTNWEIHSLTGHAVLRDTLYLSGLFQSRSAGINFMLARVEGSNLVGIPFDFIGMPIALAAYQDQLYVSVVGSGEHANELSPRIYRYDGSVWSPVTGGDGQTLVGTALTSRTKSKFVEYLGEMYVSGLFKLSGATQLTSIAKWDGTNWVDMNLNLPRDPLGGIGSMILFNDKLVATYWAAASGVWQLSGPSWTNLAEVGPGGARQVLVKDGQLILLGEFMSVDDATISYAATPNYCCVGTRGNVDGDAADAVDLSDLSSMVLFLVAGVVPTSDCPIESDIDGSLNVDLSDLSILIAYLTQTENKPALSTCP
jgi:hypothetical protein